MIKKNALFAIIFLLMASCDNHGAGKSAPAQGTDSRQDTSTLPGDSDKTADSASATDSTTDPGNIPDSNTSITTNTTLSTDSVSDGNAASDSDEASTDTGIDTMLDTATVLFDSASEQSTDTGMIPADSSSDADTATDTGDTGSDADSSPETVDTDDSPHDWCGGPASTPYASADILLVVDNSRSMKEEQKILATAMFTLVNALANPLDETKKPIDDIRIAVTTTDLGVSVNGEPFNDEEAQFDNEAACAGLGDNGAFITEYQSDVIDIQEGVIACDSDAAQCPPQWRCDMAARVADTETEMETETETETETDFAARASGVCMAPNENGLNVTCPASPFETNTAFVDNERDDKALAVACLAGNLGINGCNFEQQMKASVAGLANNVGFVRADSLTAVIIVSDENDCSISSFAWHEVEELGSLSVNLACDRHPEYLTPIGELKTSLESAKTAAGGNADDLVFAAITGVPMVDACQGAGDQIPDCQNVHPLVNGEGTMAEPEEVSRISGTGVEQYYAEYACERYEGEIAVTSAYPGMRYVQLAQSFGAKGYIYSICNSNWSSAMENIASVVQENAKIICLE